MSGANGGSISHPPATIEQLREGAVNALAAAIVKTRGGKVSDEKRWLRAFMAAEIVVDAIAEYVIGRSRAEVQ